MEVEEVIPEPAYCETIAKSQETAYRHKKQTGGAGQFADVRLIVAPAPRGTGFAFSEVVKGGAVPRNYIPAVETGARDAMERGPLGFPVVDVSVTLTDGQAHAVDSSDMAFRIAGRQGTKEALKSAGAGPAPAGVQGHDPRAGDVHRRPRAHRLLALRPGPRLRHRSLAPPAGSATTPSSPAARSPASPTTSAPRRKGWAGSSRPSTTTRSCTARPPTASSPSARRSPPDARQAGSNSATSSTSPGGSRAIDPSRRIRGLDGAGLAAPMVDDHALVTIDDQVVVQARHPEVAAELGVHVHGAGRGRQDLDHDDGIDDGVRVTGKLGGRSGRRRRERRPTHRRCGGRRRR